MTVPCEPDASAMIETDLATSAVGEVVGRERLAAEMVDPVRRCLRRFVCYVGRLMVRVGEPLGAALPNPELLAGWLAPDRDCDRPDFVLVQWWSALQTVGLEERSEDDRRWRPTPAHRARE